MNENAEGEKCMSIRRNTTPEISVKRLRMRTRAQFGMLLLQVFLGMAVNLIGLPSETSGGQKMTTSVFL